ncbi:unnamed protein product [Brassica napus]|uniref:(rape) hypothetical protein n=1 Tax=Brassica napus TaxID=3708 RepID=A0A816L9E7_BRANA|nr:unnamed protein product [Brassica napus]
MFFKDICHHESQLRFRLLHFWEAWNPIKKTFIGLEMLLINEQGTVIQGFISPGRIQTYLNSTTSMDPETKPCSGFLIIPRPCRSHGTQNCRFFKTAMLLLMKTVSGFIRMKNFKLAVISKETSTDAFFECTATIDDVVHDSGWYYIACSGCNTKVTNGATSMICTNSKCGKINVAGVAQYRSKISVYDNSGKAFLYYLVMLANGNEEGNHEAPVLEALISTIGQRHKFCVKVTEHNLSGKTRSLTVTKILPLDTPPATMSSEEDHTTATSEEAFKRRLDSADGSKRTCGSDEIEEAKRLKCWN